MKHERRLAEAAVASFGQPDFPLRMSALVEAVGNENTRQHLLGRAGLQHAMVAHAKGSFSNGQIEMARATLQNVHSMFGNGTRKKQ